RNNTVEPGPKLLPTTMIVWPRAARTGVTDVIAGFNAVISIMNPFDGPPPGAGLTTVTVWAPNGSGGGKGAVNWVEETNVVCNVCLPTRILAPLTNFSPVTVSTASCRSPVSFAGLTPLIAGTGFSTGNVSGSLVPPPGGGFVTTRRNTPACPNRLPGIVAARLAEELYEVAMDFPLMLAAEFSVNP